MGENGSPPLARRVPGTTSMPKAHGRRPPPKLPDGVLERLRAEILAARERANAELQASEAGPSQESSPHENSRGALPKRSRLAALPKASKAAPLPDEDRTTPSQQEAEFTPLNGRAEPAPLPQRPEVAPRIERPKLAPLREEPTPAALPERQRADPIPKRPNVAQRRVWPAFAPQPTPWTEEASEAAQPEWEVLPDSPRAPLADSDDITEPIPVVAPPSSSGTAKPIRDLINDQAAPATPERSRRPASAKNPRRSHRPAKPRPTRESPRPVSRREPARSQRAVRPKRPPRLARPQFEADNQVPKLGALFAEAASFEDVVASARLEAGSQVAIEWRHVITAACLAALILVAVAVFVFELAS